MSIRAKLFIGAMAAVGASLLIHALSHWQSADLTRFACYLIMAVLASGLKVRLPGIEGTLSINFLFILAGVLEMSLPETLVIGCTASLAQTLWQSRNKAVIAKVLFNVLGMMANAVTLSYFTYHRLAGVIGESTPLLLGVAALVFFFANTIPVSLIIAMTEDRSLRQVWTECYVWSFPYYLVGAALVFLINVVNHYAGWQTSLLVLPLIFWVYRSYRNYLARLEAEKKQVEIEKRHVEKTAALNMRTIEALALAIEAKDHTSHRHLQRVRVFAVAIAQELGLVEEQIEAVRAAALLHDVGKLAIPEHIINKPGRLTPEEFEKVKIHPIVGANILERAAFPYPVAPIVRSHHEKWDGSGYPDGLKGDKIPIGARILAAVDCLDALTSHRQYRNALSLDAAMQKVAAMAGTAYDPKVVGILQARLPELERAAQAQPGASSMLDLSDPAQADHGDAAAAGLAAQPATNAMPGTESDFLTSIASARQEAQTMFELSQDLGNSLSLGETLSVLSMRLRKLIPYDSMVVFLCRNGRLVPELVSGDNFRLLSSLNIRIGDGLCGWVAEHRKPIVNGNPALESGYVSDPEKFTTLRSAIAVPLEGLSGVVGVLAMYQSDSDAFTADNLRILLAITSKIALSIENALKYQQAESSATTDYLTGLPNARSLFVHLAQELSRCRRTGTSLAVMVGDLDNFKQVNDLFGHLDGDRLLREFGAKLKETCRGYDYVARMSGDEFVLVVPGLEPNAAAEKAARLNQLAVEVGHSITGRDIVSLSVGTSFCPEDGFDVERLLSEADRRMYSVKQLHHEDAERAHGVPSTKAASASVN